MTTAIEAALERRWRAPAHRDPAPCGSYHCRDGTVVNLTLDGPNWIFVAVPCPMCADPEGLGR